MSTLLFGVVYAGLALVTDMRDLWKAVGRYVLDATVVACTTASVGFVVMTTSAREVPALHDFPVVTRAHIAHCTSASMRVRCRVLQSYSHPCPDAAHRVLHLCLCAHVC
jgi:hypothetical protein